MKFLVPLRYSIISILKKIFNVSNFLNISENLTGCVTAFARVIVLEIACYKRYNVHWEINAHSGQKCNYMI